MHKLADMIEVAAIVAQHLLIVAAVTVPIWGTILIGSLIR